MSQISPSSGRVSRRGMLRLTWALPWAVLLAGCGQKGPLYHPPEPPAEENEEDQTSAAPAAAGTRRA